MLGTGLIFMLLAALVLSSLPGLLTAAIARSAKGNGRRLGLSLVVGGIVVLFGRLIWSAMHHDQIIFRILCVGLVIALASAIAGARLAWRADRPNPPDVF